MYRLPVRRRASSSSFRLEESARRPVQLGPGIPSSRRALEFRINQSARFSTEPASTLNPRRWASQYDSAAYCVCDVSPVALSVITPTAVLLLPRFQSVQVVFDFAGILLRRNFAEKNNREPVAVVVELRCRRGWPSLDLAHSSMASRDSWVIELAGFEKARPIRHLPPRCVVGVRLRGTGAPALTNFLTFGLSGVSPARTRRPAERRPAAPTAQSQAAAYARAGSMSVLGRKSPIIATSLPFTVASVFPIMDTTGQVAQLVEHRTEKATVVVQFARVF